MPKLCAGGKNIEHSRFTFKPVHGLKDRLGRYMIQILETVGLAQVNRARNGDWIDCNNLTLINIILLYGGPMRESQLAWCICLVQVFGSLIGFFIRYGLVHIVYN